MRSRHPVRVQDVPANYPKDSAIISGDSLEATRPYFERAIGIAVWVIGAIGTLVVFNGGWEPTLAGSLRREIIYGLIFQCVLTYIQWTYAKRWWLWRYRVSLAIDGGFNAVGYSPVLLPFFGAILTRLAMPDADAWFLPRLIIGWLLVVICALVVARLPEVALVD